MEKQRCSKTVFTGERWDFGGHQCSRTAKVRIKGVWYCTIHAPAYEAEKQRKCHKKYERESAARQATWKAQAAREQARDACMQDKADLIAALMECESAFSELWMYIPVDGEYVREGSNVLQAARALLARLDKGGKL